MPASSLLQVFAQAHLLRKALADPLKTAPRAPSTPSPRFPFLHVHISLPSVVCLFALGRGFRGVGACCPCCLWPCPSARSSSRGRAR